MLPEALLTQLKDLLESQMGLNFCGKGWLDFEARIASAAREAGARDAKDYINQLLSAPLSQTHIEQLARHLTVGETYFFREKGSFDALANHLLPELLRARELTQRRLRIWSAGCCTGEEAYSIAIVLDRLLQHQGGWDISIVGTDINPAFLDKARRGLYNEWSFRGTPDWVREHYFKKKKGTYEISPNIRERVKFLYLNLATDQYPSASTGTDHLDAIFCRNVLMYFSTEQARRVIRRFQAALQEDGLLLVSPTETSATLFSGFSLVDYPGARFYRKTSAAETKPTVPQHPILPKAKRIPAKPQKVKPATYRPPPVKSTPITTEPLTTGTPIVIEDASVLIREARTRADEGKLDEAAQCCERAIALNKLSPISHYLLATIEQERGNIQQAITALQRTLYLDQEFVLAHFALANLRLIEGRRKDAGRHLDTVGKLLKAYATDDTLPESDGMTAGRLNEIATTLTASLSEPQQITAIYG